MIPYAYVNTKEVKMWAERKPPIHSDVQLFCGGIG